MLGKGVVENYQSYITQCNVSFCVPVSVCQYGLVVCCFIVECVGFASMTNPCTLILLGKELILTQRLWMYNIMSHSVGLIDVVFSAFLLHTKSHLYHLSSTAQRQVWPTSQTISNVHVSTHDRHKLSRARRAHSLQ